MKKEKTTPGSCVLRLFGVPEQTVQQAVTNLPETWQVTAQCRSRGAESLIALQGPAESLHRAERSLKTTFAADLYGEGDTGLAQAAVQALETHRRLLVCGDAAAGALLEARLETVPGAEKVFDFGTLSYADKTAAALIDRKTQKGRKAPQSEAARALARVQAAQKVVGAELAAACVEQPDCCLLLLGGKKGCWVRCVPQEQNPALWLLDMIRRAACGLPQAGGTIWQRCRDPLPDSVLTPAELTGSPSAPPRRRHILRNVILLLCLLALAALAAGWYFTDGDLAALPQKLQSFGAQSAPHAGAKLL